MHIKWNWKAPPRVELPVNDEGKKTNNNNEKIRYKKHKTKRI